MNKLSQLSVNVGDVIWYVDTITADLIYNIDGQDNSKLVSIAAIRDGVFGHPLEVNHLDLWANYQYSIPELKSLVALRNSSKESFEFKNIELNDKFEKWSNKVVAGKITFDGNKIFIVASHLTELITKKICSFFTRLGLLSTDSVVYFNSEDYGPVSDLFIKPENTTLSNSYPITQLAFIKTAEQESQEVIDLVNEYKNGPDKQSAGEKLYEKYHKLVRQLLNTAWKVNPVYNKYPISEDNEIYSEKLQEVMVGFLQSLLNFDPSKDKLSTFIYSSVSGNVINALNLSRSIGTEDTNFHTVNAPHSKNEAEEGGFSFDRMVDNSQPEVVPEKSDLMELIKKTLQNPKLYKIFTDYEINDRTLEDIGNEYGVTRERIRQLIEKAKEMLRSDPSFKEYSLDKESIKLGMLFNDNRTIKFIVK